MKQRIEKVKQVAASPETKAALHSMKPKKNIWGFLGVVVFFIVPEVVAYVWGAEITHYATAMLALEPGVLHYYYDALIYTFKDGISWLNLSLGIALLIWLFF